MRTKRSHLSKLSTVVLIAIFAAGCSSTTSADAAVFDQARDLGQDLNRAVAATQDAVTGFAEPAFAARAIDRASSSSRQLAEVATQIQAPELRRATVELVTVANRIVTQLTQGDVASAQSLRANTFVPIASEIAQLKGTLPATTQTPDSSAGSSIVVAFVIIVVVVGGVAMMLRRARGRTDAAEPKAEAIRPDTEPQPERTWDEPHPLYVDHTQSDPVVSESADIARTTRMRPIDIDLPSLLDSVIEQARERDWMVSLVSPEVHISGDPVRVQRAILATLGNAFLEGAELVGIIVEVVDGQVLLSIGHDAPIDDDKAEDIAIRLADQLAYALSREELGWSVAADGEIYLTTVSAGTPRVIEAEAAEAVDAEAEEPAEAEEEVSV